MRAMAVTSYDEPLAADRGAGARAAARPRDAGDPHERGLLQRREDVAGADAVQRGSRPPPCPGPRDPRACRRGGSTGLDRRGDARGRVPLLVVRRMLRVPPRRRDALPADDRLDRVHPSRGLHRTDRGPLGTPRRDPPVDRPDPCGIDVVCARHGVSIRGHARRGRGRHDGSGHRPRRGRDPRGAGRPGLGRSHDLLRHPRAHDRRGAGSRSGRGARGRPGRDRRDRRTRPAATGSTSSIDTVGHDDTLALARRLVRPGGRVVGVGYAPDSSLTVPTTRLVLDEVDYVGIAVRPSGRPREGGVARRTRPRLDGGRDGAAAGSR